MCLCVKREAVIRGFRSGSVWVLICTDVMCRGMDFKGVNLVVNYDFPNSDYVYIHRIGNKLCIYVKMISRMPGLLYGFFSLLRFFLVFSYRYFLPFYFFCLRSLISPIIIFFLIFIFTFLVPKSSKNI